MSYSSSTMGPRRRQRKEGSFKAADGFGHTHRIDVYTELLAGGADGPQSLLTADGETVERLGKGRYRIIHGGLNLNLSSDDPEAP
jgi:hypothetical protein